MNNISFQREITREECAPIYNSIEHAKQTVTELKEKMTRCVDKAIDELEHTNPTMGAPKKSINNEIKNLKTLKKEISKAKIENGDQAEKIVSKITTKIHSAERKCYAKNISQKMVADLSELALEFDSEVVETSKNLNSLIQKELNSVAGKQLTFTKKLQNILQKISSFFCKHTDEAKLSDIEKAAHKLEQLVPQKNALIQAEWKKGLPAEAANRKPASVVEKEIKEFKTDLMQKLPSLRKIYNSELNDADKKLDDLKHVNDNLMKISTALAETSALLNSSGTDEDIAQLHELVTKHSNLARKSRSDDLSSDLISLNDKLKESNNKIKLLNSAIRSKGLDDTTSLKEELEMHKTEKRHLEFEIIALQAQIDKRGALMGSLIERRISMENELLSAPENRKVELKQQLTLIKKQIKKVNQERQDYMAVPYSLEKALESLKDPVTPDAFRNAMVPIKQEIDNLQKQIEKTRKDIIGSAHQAREKAVLKIETLESCLADEWPGVPTADFRSRADSERYVADARNRLDKAIAFFRNDIKTVKYSESVPLSTKPAGHNLARNFFDVAADVYDDQL